MSSLSFAPGAVGFSWLSVAYHFCIYFLLGFFIFLSSRIEKESFFLGFFIALIYAGLDELHQYFVPGRACNIHDFLVDGVGILIGFICSWIFYRIFRR
jgi:VanZ family protein